MYFHCNDLSCLRRTAANKRLTDIMHIRTTVLSWTTCYQCSLLRYKSSIPRLVQPAHLLDVLLRCKKTVYILFRLHHLSSASLCFPFFSLQALPHSRLHGILTIDFSPPPVGFSLNQSFPKADTNFSNPLLTDLLPYSSFLPCPARDGVAVNEKIVSLS